MIKLVLLDVGVAPAEARVVHDNLSPDTMLLWARRNRGSVVLVLAYDKVVLALKERMTRAGCWGSTSTPARTYAGVSLTFACCLSATVTQGEHSAAAELSTQLQALLSEQLALRGAPSGVMLHSAWQPSPGGSMVSALVSLSTNIDRLPSRHWD